jgi:hypothetical protein
MRITKRRRKWSVLSFLAILTLGMLGTTLAYRRTQLVGPSNLIDEKLSDRHKELISTELELAKWLLGIASGSLAAIVGIRLRNEKSGDLFDFIPMIAYGFLLTSLYGGFLSYQATLNVLRLGPLDYLYGNQMQFPILIQFWSLIAGLILLSVWLFRRNSKIVIAALILFCCCSSPAPAAAVGEQQCLQHWSKDRGLRLESEEDVVVDLLHRLGRVKDAKTIKNCADIEVILDTLRFDSTLAGNEDTSTAFNRYVKSIDSELSHTELSSSDVVQALVKLMAIWDKPFGVLSVRSSKGPFTVLIDGVERGFTNWLGRLEPGLHRIRVMAKGVVVYTSDNLAISEGSTKEINVDDPAA